MIHIIVGTRAQLIKMGPLMFRLKERGIDFNFILIAQHRETINSMIEMFGIDPPDYNIGNPDDEIDTIGKMIPWTIGILRFSRRHSNEIFKGDKNGIVLVHGDALPAIIGAKIARAAGLKVGHVEAGLRSFSIFNPFPEEIIRRYTSRIADLHFASDETAINNLFKYRGEKVNTFANTLYDSLMMALKNESKTKIPGEPFCIFTTHRFENLKSSNRWGYILDSLKKASQIMKTIFIMHPVTRKRLSETAELKLLKKNSNIVFEKRLDYFPFVKLLNEAEFFVTDGGSNQEECSYLGKPCFIMRKKTERQEGLGKNAVLGHFDEHAFEEFLTDYKKWAKPHLEIETSPAEIIINALHDYF